MPDLTSAWTGAVPRAAAVPPVVLVVFNRPDLTAAAMRRLARVRPGVLMVVADGPRDSLERSRCDQARRAVREGLTWDADVRWCVSEDNLGCAARVETGLDWAFSQVDRAIVLEDDVEVAPEFFPFAADLLEHAADDPRLAMICARNALVEFPAQPGCMLSRRGFVWGWATWADRWQAYRADGVRGITEDALARAYAQSPVMSRLARQGWRARLWQASGDWVDPWSMWWACQDMWALTPSMNLALNHGFGPGGTHTTASDDLRAAVPFGRRRDALRADLAGAAPCAQYAQWAALLDIVVSYADPRRWRLLARARRDPGLADEAWQLMLEPWDRADETRAMLTHLSSLMASPNLDRLVGAFA